MDLARAAEALVGSPFRLHGRDPATGLDCLGVLAAAYRMSGRTAVLPTGYTLRTRAAPPLERFVRACGLSDARGAIEPGDVLLVRTAPCQLHLLIAGCSDRFVHAHAGARRVIAQAGPLDRPIIHHWRLAATDRG